MSNTLFYTKWFCPECNSDNIHAKAWVDINQRDIHSLTESKDPEDYWCNDCEQHVIPEMKQVKV